MLTCDASLDTCKMLNGYMCCALRRDVLYETAADGSTKVTGLRIGATMNNLRTVTADVYVAALDVPGIKKFLPQPWRKFKQFDDIYRLAGVPVITVQLRYNGWVTEMQDPAKVSVLGLHIAGGCRVAGTGSCQQGG